MRLKCERKPKSRRPKDDEVERKRKYRRLLDIEVLESRVPVSEQLGTALAVGALSYAGGLMARLAAPALMEEPFSAKIRTAEPSHDSAVMAAWPTPPKQSEASSRETFTKDQRLGPRNFLPEVNYPEPKLFDDLTQDYFDLVGAAGRAKEKGRINALSEGPSHPDALLNTSAGGTGGSAGALTGASSSTAQLPYAGNVQNFAVGGPANGLSATSAGIADLPAWVASQQGGPSRVPGAGGGAAHHGHHGKDPLFVLDAVNGIVAASEIGGVATSPINQAFANQSMDLRAQEIGKTVSSYSWNLSQAPDAGSVTGQGTYRLQFTWNNIAASNTDTIALTVTNTDTSQDTATVTFRVNGTASPAYPPITVPSWPSVLTPDALVPDQVMVVSQYSSVDLASGALAISHALPAYNPGVWPLALAYRSTAADRMPIFIAHYDIGSTVPTNVTAQLTLTDRNNVNIFTGSSSYGTSSAQVNGGAILEIALQATGIASQNTDRYAYQIIITGGTGANLTGQVSLVNSSAGIQNILGNGWSVAGLEHLWPISAGGPITAGAIVDLGTGLSLWYPSNGVGGFLAPQPNDFSTLTLASGVYTRTLKDGTKYKFDSTYGLETSVTDRNNNTLTYSYDPNTRKLLYMTDFNNQVTTLSYSGSHVSSITDPASRVMSLAYDGSGRLNQITDPTPGGSAATPVTTFVYDTTVDRILRMQDPDGNTTTFSYNSAGRVQTINRPQSVTEQFTPVQMAGLGGTVALAAQAQATFTDGNTHAWQTYLDWLGYGRSTQQIDPLNNEALQYRDGNDLPWVADDPLGNRTRYSFDSKGNPTKIVLPDDNVLTYTYDSHSLPLTYTSPPNLVTTFSHVTTFTRDASGNLTKITLPDPGDGTGSPVITFTYYGTAPGGRLQTSVTPRGYTTTYSYDTTIKNQLVQIQYPTSGLPTIQLGYDSASNLSFRTDENGYTTTTVYDKLNRLTQATQPTDVAPNPVWTYAYDAASNQISLTDPLGKVTTFSYDGLNRLIGITDPLLHTTTYTYDGASNRSTMKDALTHVTTYSYDQANRLVGITGAITDALNHTWTYGYDAAGAMTSVTDPLLDITTYSYNSRGFLSGVTNPLGNQLTYAYNANGDVTAMTEYDAGGGGRPTQTFTSTFSYDNLDRMTKASDPLGKSITYAYDKDGNMISVRGAYSGNPVTEGNLTKGNQNFAYDERDRRNQITRISTTGGSNLTYTLGYDSAGNVRSITEPLITGMSNSYVITYLYDPTNHIKQIQNPVDPATLNRDKLHRLSSLTDPANNVTTYNYDDAGRLIFTQDPNGHYTTYTYDAANRLTLKTDRDGRQTSYGYDNANRLATETWLSTPNRTITYTYDNANRLTAATDPDSTYAFGYDNASELTSVDNQGTPIVPRVLLTYGYDGLGNRIKLLDNFTQQGNISYGYDGDHHLTGMSMTVGSNQGPQVTFHYDAKNNLDSLTRFLTTPGNTVQSTFHYDGYGRQDIITHAAGAATLATYTYTYDEDSRVTGFQGPTDSVTYSYDGNNELLTVNGTNTENYSYDHNGNRNMTGYVTATGNEMTADGTYTYSYDNEGNILTKAGPGLLVTYTWDYRNRLTRVQSNQGTQDVTFTYDMFDRRIYKSALAGIQQATVYDGGNPYADFNNGATAPTYRYVYGEALDQLFARYDGTSGNPSTIWYLTDRLGSVRQMVQTDGVTGLATIGYDSFGNVLSGSVDRYGFTGQQYDSETLLYYDRARYYSPAVGRFVSQDPVGFAGGDVNLYRYVYNSPTNGTDPTGLDGSSTQLLGTTPSPDEGRDFESIGADFGPRSSAPTGIDSAFPTPLPPYSGPSIGAPSKDPQIQYINEAPDPEERERRLRNLKMERAGYSGWYISLEWLGAHGGLELFAGAFAGFAGPSSNGVPRGSPGMNNPTTADAVNTGNRFHYDQLNGGTGIGGPSQLQGQYPKTEFFFRPRGSRGPDVRVIGGTLPWEYPGSTWKPGNYHGDFKPWTPSGQGTFPREINSGKLPPDTQPLWYDPIGFILK